MSLIIQVIEDFGAFLQIEESWNKLYELATEKEIFYTFEWHKAWWLSLGKTRQMRILVFKDGNNVVGIMPMVAYRTNIRDGYLRLLEFSGSSQSDRQNLLYHPQYTDEIMLNMGVAFKKLLSGVDVLRLHNIASTSPLLTCDFLAPKAFLQNRTPLPYLSLETSLEELSKKWRGSHRGDVRRQFNRLSKFGALKLEQITEWNSCEKHLNDFLAMHGALWESKSQAMKKRNLQTGSFFRALMKELWERGVIHFSMLTLDKKPISYHFGFLENRKLYYYKPAYSLEYANFSPGKVHIYLLIENGIKNGWQTYDFLGGNEKYKYAWTNLEDYSYTLYISGNGLFGALGKWWFLSGRDKLKQWQQSLKK